MCELSQPWPRNYRWRPLSKIQMRGKPYKALQWVVVESLLCPKAHMRCEWLSSLRVITYSGHLSRCLNRFHLWDRHALPTKLFLVTSTSTKVNSRRELMAPTKLPEHTASEETGEWQKVYNQARKIAAKSAQLMRVCSWGQRKPSLKQLLKLRTPNK